MTGSVAPPPTQRPEPVVRGFLFADLRGYTAFVERVGDAAAVELLERYRGLVRAVVAEQAGAEIRTEGDSFYIVFPSPSAAVRAGLELVARAAVDATDHPTDPIAIGVGIHAGESAETGEGYVGSAVNLAARICSVARAGEVLVSSTVRSLARTSLPVTYTSRGRPALKGVTEPIELYAVAQAAGVAGPVAGGRLAAPVSTPARAGLIGLGAAVVVLAVVGIAAFAGGGSGGATPSPSGGASGGIGGASPSAGGTSASPPAASAEPAEFRYGPLQAGTYRTTLFTPALEFTVPDGWTALLELPNALILGRRDDPMRASYDAIPAAEIGGRLTIIRTALAASPCTPRVPLDGRPLPSGSNVEIPAGRDGFLAWARNDPTFVLGLPSAVRLGAFDTTGYEVALSDVCDLRASMFDSAEVFPLAEGTAGSQGTGRTRWSMFRGNRTWWYLWELDRQTMLLAIDTPEEFPEFEDAARSVLTSLRPAD